MSVEMCRTCLSHSAQTKTILNTPLQEIYEKLSNSKLITGDRKPDTVCYNCYSELESCHNFAILSQESNIALTRLCHDSIEIPKEKISFNVSNTENFVNVETDLKKEVDTVKVEIEDVFIKKEGSVYNENYKVIKNRCLANICKSKEKIKNRKNTNKKILRDISKKYSDKVNEFVSRENPYNKDVMQCSTHINSQIEKPYNCDKCNKTFKNKNNLKAHIKIHVGEKLSACDRCGKTFPSRYQLKRHMRSHTGEKPYKCDQCCRTFSDRSNLKKHIATHSGQKSFICSECKASFSLKGNLQRHMRSHTGDKPYFCDICKKALPDASLLKRHIRIHTGEKPYLCDTCGKSYSDKDNFKTHMRLHTGIKPYKCTFCDYKSAHASCLKLHLAKKHSK